MKLREIAPGVILLPDAIVHPTYIIEGAYFNTTVQGISTWALSGAFLAGDSVLACAKAWDITEEQVEAALRWELLPRSTRLARVRRMARTPSPERAEARAGEGGK